MSPPRIAVVGSVNLDLVARASHLPAPGETVGGAAFARYPGGKGANQALAAKRLGADVALWGCVGSDAFADEALALLRAEGVDLRHCRSLDDAPTGVALIVVSDGGENQIVVAPGANERLSPGDLGVITADALLCQLEVPVPTTLAAVLQFQGFAAINLAPAIETPEALLARADLLIVNEGEAAFYGDALQRTTGWVAITYGADGAALLRGGLEVARARPPQVTARDTTGAGDTFSAALALALVEGQPPDAALVFACVAGALATTQDGAQPAMPRRGAVDTLLARC
ncbi:MAG: ribokinase [Hyphomonadaceae bacterium]|nr:ribokinase [Hyphomonadaceae bacterium]